jgi:hypothetical protein
MSSIELYSTLDDRDFSRLLVRLVSYHSLTCSDDLAMLIGLNGLNQLYDPLSQFEGKYLTRHRISGLVEQFTAMERIANTPIPTSCTISAAYLSTGCTEELRGSRWHSPEAVCYIVFVRTPNGPSS